MEEKNVLPAIYKLKRKRRHWNELNINILEQNFYALNTKLQCIKIICFCNVSETNMQTLWIVLSNEKINKNTLQITCVINLRIIVSHFEKCMQFLYTLNILYKEYLIVELLSTSYMCNICWNAMKVIKKTILSQINY